MKNAIFDYQGWENDYCLDLHKDIKSVVLGTSVVERNPDVIFAIPAYRRPSSLHRAIMSIFNQTTEYKYIIMVVDDSGEDISVQETVLNLVKKYNNLVYYKNEKNLGQAENWNRCIELAWTKWLVLLHDDDMICEDYLEKTFPVVQQETEITELGVFQYKDDCLYHEGNDAKCFNNRQSRAQTLLCKIRKGRPFFVCEHDIFQFVVPSPGCWMINREHMLKMGGFNPKFGVTLDGIFHFRNIKLGKVVILPEFLMIRNIENNTFLKQEAQIEIINMLYFFGIDFLKQYSKMKAIYYRLVLDISIVYLANGIVDKYNGMFDVKKLLLSYGVRKWLFYIPKKVIFLLNCFFLSKLVIRKGPEYE